MTERLFVDQITGEPSRDIVNEILTGKVFEPSSYNVAKRTERNPVVNFLKWTGVLDKYKAIAERQDCPAAFSRLLKDFGIKTEARGEISKIAEASGGVLVVCPVHKGAEQLQILAALEGVGKKVEVLAWPYNPVNDLILSISPQTIKPLVSRRLSPAYCHDSQRKPVNPFYSLYKLVYSKQLPESPEFADMLNDESLWEAAVDLELEGAIVIIFPTGSRYSEKWGRSIPQILRNCLTVERMLDGWHKVPSLGKVSVCGIDVSGSSHKRIVEFSEPTALADVSPSLKFTWCFSEASGIYGNYTAWEHQLMKEENETINQEVKEALQR